jgi:hypothetical protein
MPAQGLLKMSLENIKIDEWNYSFMAFIPESLVVIEKVDIYAG